MIERWIKNDLTLKRWRRFKKQKRAIGALCVFVFLLFISFTAEFWANSKPLLMGYKGEIYTPVVKQYHPSLFGQTEGSVTDYRKIDYDSDEAWAIWPLVKWDPFESNLAVTDFPAPPSRENWMGTDDRGRDVFSRLLFGFRFSIGFALLCWFFSYIIGTIIGAIMGYAGGMVDLLGQRIVEIFESMPGLMLLLILISVFGASMSLLVVFTVAFGWMMISIYIRAEFLKLRKREFVEAARAMGGSRQRQIFKHILPNALSPLVTFSPFTIAGGISLLTSLDYLGLGLPPPTPSWGELLQQAEQNFTVAWWLAVFPSLALFTTLVVLNLIGEGVRDAFDPKKTS